jgi:hypothetical protein
VSEETKAICLKEPGEQMVAANEESEGSWRQNTYLNEVNLRKVVLKGKVSSTIEALYPVRNSI